MPKRLKPSQQREEIRAYVRSYPPFEDVPERTIDSTLDELGQAHDSSTVDHLVNALPSLDGCTSLTHIEPRRPGQNMTDDERATVKAIFLEEMAKQANVTQACNVAGVARSLVYQWLESDLDFASGWSVAEQHANDVLRKEAFRRAVDGVSEPIVSMGKLVRDDAGQALTVQKYDTPLLMMLMRARMPEYRDSRSVNVEQNIQVNTSHQLTIDTRGMSSDELAAIRQIAQAMKDREQARIEKTGNETQ